jgi:uncharacterized phage-associated protein
MVRNRFNERKATQVAARFLKAADGKLEYLSVIKLMYFADREALLRWGTPITNDRYYSLDHGPVLSHVKNLIDESSSSFWNQHIAAPSDYKISIVKDPGDDQLSVAEEKLIDEIYEKNRALNWWGLRNKSHELPEWKNPEGSSVPIEIDDILRAAGIKKKERERIERELEGYRAMDALAVD